MANNGQNYNGNSYADKREYVHKDKLTKQNYVDEADKVMKSLADSKSLTSTSKLRNILSMVSEIRTDAQRGRDKKLDDDMQSRVQYLKMRIAYEVGRDPDKNPKKNKKGKIEKFVENAGLIEEISNIGSDRDNLLLFCDYMEALTAYHKFHGGKEN